MLTADLVEVRRKGEALLLVALDGDRRASAQRMAADLLSAARSRVGDSREDIEAALAAIEVPARQRKLMLGLRKVLDDACSWESEASLDPVAVRNAVFEHSAKVRAALEADQRFDREQVLADVAAQLATDPAELERVLFADLRGAHLLRGVELGQPEQLVRRYAAEQVQAVLLRAVRVHVKVWCDGPGALRALFHRIKFLRLLHRMRAGEDGAYEIDIDGPYSLFDSVTKYGLQLALLVPVLEGARRYELVANLKWGKSGAPVDLRFTHEGGGGVASGRTLSDEAQALLDALAAQESAWRPSLADAMIDLPGEGLCVPDLMLTHRKTGQVVYVELLGFWSRDAVFRRKALVEAGGTERVVFVASSHLRVREELLDGDHGGALYVYKTVPSAKVLLERVEMVAERVISR